MSIKHYVSNLLPRNAVLNIKYAYQFFERLKHGRKKVESNLEYWSIAKPHSHVFFGYYDVSPFNPISDEIIYLTLGEREQFVSININKVAKDSEKQIAYSKAWNWQQGVRLRWMPNNSREVIFNDFNGTLYLSRIINVDTREERTVSYPLYDISPDGRYGLTVDFERLGVKRPGYGYTCRSYKEDDHVLENESIDLVDLESDNKKTIITYKEIAEIEGCESKDFKNNYINHLCFSPSGQKFLFFWLTIEASRHKAYLLVHDLETHQTKLLENQEKVSHYVWEDDDHIICTAQNDNRQEHYYRYTVSSGEKMTLNPSVLNRDGHPSIYNKGVILTDTYPDTMGYQHLYLASTDDTEKEPLLDIYSNCKISGERRTDLHPRLNKGKTLICFDANVNQFRELYFLKSDCLK